MFSTPLSCTKILKKTHCFYQCFPYICTINKCLNCFQIWRTYFHQCGSKQDLLPYLPLIEEVKHIITVRDEKLNICETGVCVHILMPISRQFFHLTGSHYRDQHHTGWGAHMKTKWDGAVWGVAQWRLWGQECNLISQRFNFSSIVMSWESLADGLVFYSIKIIKKFQFVESTEGILQTNAKHIRIKINDLLF